MILRVLRSNWGLMSPYRVICLLKSVLLTWRSDGLRRQTVCLYKNREVIEGRSYEGRTGLSTKELNRGNVSLNFREFRESDIGVYLCQVISKDRTEEITIELEAREDTDGQPVNQPSKIQGRQVYLTLHKSNRTCGENQRMKMEESALMTGVVKVYYVCVL
ncbi:hypothetical protein R3I94_002855 [Phoxinus phoxinus]